MKLTAKAIERIKHDPAKGRQYDVKDDSTRGLYLRLAVTGRKAWVFRYKLRQKQRVIVIAEVSTADDTEESRKATGRMTLAGARDQAAVFTAMVNSHEDPGALRQKQQAARRGMPTVEEFGADFINLYSKPKKKTWKDDQESLKNWVYPRIGKIKLSDVHRRDIVAVLDEVRSAGYKRAPGLVLAVTRRMFRFAVERGILETSPCIYISERQPPAARKAMTAEQIRLWWNKADEAIESEEPTIHKPSALALKLLLLTGQRPGEVAGLRTDELRMNIAPTDGGPVWNIPAERRKRGKPHTVALTPEAVRVVKSALPYAKNGQLFVGAKGNGLRTDSGLLAPLREIFRNAEGRPTPHSARHTVATELASLGFDELEIALVLGHQSRTITGLVYINRRSLAGQRLLLEAWEKKLLAIQCGNNTNT